MPIIGNLPSSLANGTTADATQVMSDFNFIVNQVNANANPVGTLTAPTGTRMSFNQASAPTGWTTDTSAAMTDCSMRINSGTGGATGGSTAWSSWNFGGAFNVNAFTLSIAQLPAHSHVDAGHSHGVTDPTHYHALIDTGGNLASALTTNNANPLSPGGTGSNVSVSNRTQSVATGISINTGAANIQNTGSGAAIQPNFTTPQVKYTDFIVAVKQ